MLLQLRCLATVSGHSKILFEHWCVMTHRKEGAIEVGSQKEAQQATQAAADAIHGLGRGGNVPHAAPQASASAPGTAALHFMTHP